MTRRKFLTSLRRVAADEGTSLIVSRYESTGHHRRIKLGDREATVIWSDNLTPGVVRRVLQRLKVDPDDTTPT